MNYLNPYDKIRRENEIKKHEDDKKNSAQIKKTRLERKKEHRKGARKFIINYHKELEGANKDTITSYQNYIKSTKIGKAAEVNEKKES